MKIDVEDVLFWMDAIRNANDRYRVLESFWKGQVHSKVWIVHRLEELLNNKEVDIVIHGGWNGILASLLFNSKLNVLKITSVDIDAECEVVASTVNKRQEIDGRFCAVTADSTVVPFTSNVVVNTICEHLTQEQHDAWLELVPNGALIVLQGNNYYECKEHVRCSSSIEEFIQQSGISPLWLGEYETQKYTRYMVIGEKIV